MSDKQKNNISSNMESFILKIAKEVHTAYTKSKQSLEFSEANAETVKIVDTDNYKKFVENLKQK